MFATPSCAASTRGESGARRCLQLTSTRPVGSRHQSDDGESPLPESENSSAEMLRILKGLQQQVSALQAQQNQIASKKTSVSPDSSTTTPQEKRKLPKELTVSYYQV